VLGTDIPLQGATKATFNTEPNVSFAHINDGYSVFAEATGKVSVQEPRELNYQIRTIEQNIQVSFPQDDFQKVVNHYQLN